MADGIYAALSGGISNLEILDVLSNNLANADAIGFKEDRPLFAEVLRQRLPGVVDDSTQVAVRGMATDLRQGALVRTGNPLDLALVGDGFFAVETAQGVRYTRRGDFRLGDRGRLQTAGGAAVLGQGGPIHVPPGALAIDEQGNLSVDGRLVDRLRIVDFPASALGKEGEGLFVARERERASAAQVLSGHLERSNVSAVGAMTQMIAASRSFEIAMQAVQHHRQMDSRLIADLGKGT
jgi:flagellar basal-body rod protein FlgF